MAKNSLFWGKASGKLGEMVLYRAGGEQRARTYVQNVKNPKSLAQMKQRIKMASLVGFFSAAREVLRASFPNRKTNQSGFNAFMAASLPMATTAIDKANAEKGLSVPVGYALSRGNIAIPNGAFTPGTDTNEDILGYLQTAVRPDMEIKSVTLSGGKIAEHMQNLLDLYPALDAELPMKFKVTVVSCGYVDEGFDTETLQIEFDRSSGALQVVGNQPVAFRNGALFCGSVTYTNDIALPTFNVVTAGNTNGCIIGGAFISYTDVDGKIRVSSANMDVLHDAGGYIEQFQDGGLVYNQYLEDLGYTPDNILSTR